MNLNIFLLNSNYWVGCMNHYLVAYDICCPKRRRKLLKILEDFAYRVQYSVFEMCVGEAELQKIKGCIEHTIKKDEDSVLIYELGAFAVKKRTIYGLINKNAEDSINKYRIL